MSTAKFQITLELTLIQPYDDERTIVDDLMVQLKASDGIDQTQFQKNGMPTEDGHRILTIAFAHGIVGCARLAEIQNWCSGEAVVQNVLENIGQLMRIDPKITINDVTQ
jgi:hypothetical protein